jgi:hypothetical protein
MIARLPASFGLSELIADAFTVMVRRRFARADVRLITQYVGEAIVRAEGEYVSGTLIRAAEATVRAALGEYSLLDGVQHSHSGKAQLMLLLDLIESDGLLEQERDELVVLAEDTSYQRSRAPDAEALYPTPFRRWFRRLRWPRRPPPDGRGTGSGTPTDLTTLAGLRLRARIVGNTAALAGLPEERGEAGLAVVEALFELAMKQRFAADFCVRDVALFVSTMLRRSSRKLRASSIEMEAVVRRQLGESVLIDDISHAAVLEVKVLAARSAIADLGLFYHEIDDLIARSEQLAKERGFRPTSAPSEIDDKDPM